MIMSRYILLVLAAFAIFCERQTCLAAGDMGEVGSLQNIFKCYSASNWYGKCGTNYACLVKRWPSQLPAPLRTAVFSEQRECNGGIRHLFLFPSVEHSNQLFRLEVVCADSVELAHRAMLEYFSDCSATQPFPAASKSTGMVGDYCYFGYGKIWTCVMFVRNNAFVVLKSPMPSVSVRREAYVVDEELIRLSSPESAIRINSEACMPDAPTTKQSMFSEIGKANTSKVLSKTPKDDEMR